jgi:hypothetical protein
MRNRFSPRWTVCVTRPVGDGVAVGAGGVDVGGTAVAGTEVGVGVGVTGVTVEVAVAVPATDWAAWVEFAAAVDNWSWADGAAGVAVTLGAAGL